MPLAPAKSSRPSAGRGLDLARVLLVQDELATRLALQSILEAGGYAVDVAASAPEAVCKLDNGEYELVLSDSGIEARSAGGGVLPYARTKDYRPATALITAYQDSRNLRSGDEGERQVSVPAEDVSTLLSKVADLIGFRARRRSGRALRQVAV